MPATTLSPHRETVNSQAPQQRSQLAQIPHRVVGLAPRKVAVFPLVKTEGLPEIAEAIYKDCKRHMTAFYDDKGAVGRRYRRQDEIGTPFCVTVDGDTLSDGTVTIRDRDTMQQERVAISDLHRIIDEKVNMRGLLG